MSQESALKYFLLGAFSSAFFLMGIAYLYGYSAAVSFSGIHAAVIGGTGNDTVNGGDGDDFIFQSSTDGRDLIAGEDPLAVP